jgi:superfamily II DNA helicase RecQ
VSPLLSLMHDQVSRLPPGLPGAMLQGIMSRAEVQEVREAHWDPSLCRCHMPALLLEGLQCVVDLALTQ